MTSKIAAAPLTRSLSEIANEIRHDYMRRGKPLYYAAVPYVSAMTALNSLDDRFYEDSGVDVVRYALSNLSTWRGETAQRVKAELKAALADYDAKRRVVR